MCRTVYFTCTSILESLADTVFVEIKRGVSQVDWREPFVTIVRAKQGLVIVRVSMGF